jgi:hypothetical protein
MKSCAKPMLEPLETRLMLDATIWLIDGDNHVTMYDAQNPTGAAFVTADLLGSGADDVYVFADDTAEISGQIDGQGGHDVLHYGAYDNDTYGIHTTGYTGAVEVDYGMGDGAGVSNFVDIEGAVGGSGVNSLIGPDSGALWNVTGQNSGTLAGDFTFENFANLTGGTGDDIFEFGATGALNGTLISGEGNDTLDLSALSSTLYWTIIGDNAGSVSDNATLHLDFTSMENLAGGGGVDDFLLNDGTMISGTIHGGGGTDVLNAWGYLTGLQWNITGPDAGVITDGAEFADIESLIGGGGDDVFTFTTSGSLLSGFLEGRGGVDTIDYAGYGAANEVTFNLQTRQATGIGVGWNRIEQAVAGSAATNTLIGLDAENLWTLTGHDVGTVDSASGGFGFAGFSQLQGGSGQDQFVFDDGRIVTGYVSGGGGNDTLNLAAYQTSNTWKINVNDAGHVEAAQGQIFFDTMENLTGGDAGDVFQFGTGVSLTGQLTAGAGVDTVDMRSFLNDILWDIVGVGQGTAEDADGVADPIVFTGVERLYSGDGDDVFDIADGAGVNGELRGGGGNDTIDMADHGLTDVTWNILEDNGGTVLDSTAFAFDSVENLIGGDADDTFIFADGTGVDGDITGGGQMTSDSLDYSDYSALHPVTVNRQAGAATNINHYTGIERVVGGQGVDSLIGLDAPAAAWNVTGDDAGNIDGTFRFESFGNLTGGTGDDAFHLDDGATLSGSIHGQTGENTLSLAGYSTGSTWSLTGDHAGDLIAGGETMPFASVQNLIGGEAVDTFNVGNQVMVDTIQGRDGNDILNLTEYTTGLYIFFDDPIAGDGRVEVGVPVPQDRIIHFQSIQDVQNSQTGVIASNYIDLTGTVTPDAIFGEISPSQRGTIRVNVVNQGNIRAEATIDIILYASAGDATIDLGADLVLGVLAGANISLEAGASKEFSIQVVLPGDIPAGTYNILAHIDAADAVQELSEVNNVVVADQPLNVIWQFGRVAGRNNVSLTVMDADGTPVTFSLRGEGAGSVIGGPAFTLISLTGTNNRSVLMVTTPRGTTTTLFDITVDGSLGMILARTANLAGTIDVDGTLRMITMQDTAAGAAINVQDGSTAVASITFNRVQDLTVNLAGGLTRFIAVEWLDTDAQQDVVNAAWVGTIMTRGARDNRRTPEDESSAGNFQADLNLTGVGATRTTLAATNIAGDVVDANWNIVGQVGSIYVRGMVDGWTLNGGVIDIRSLRLGDVQSANVIAAGDISSIMAIQWIGGIVEAQTLRSLRTTGQRARGNLVALAGNFQANVTLNGSANPRLMTLGSAFIVGDCINSQWNLTGDVSRFMVRGTVLNSRLQTTGDIRSLMLGATEGSDFLAGVNKAFAGRFSQDRADFVKEDAKIWTISISGLRGVDPATRFVVDTHFTAGQFGNINLLNADLNTVGIHVLGGEENIGSIRHTDKADRDNSWVWRAGRVPPNFPVTPLIETIP